MRKLSILFLLAVATTMYAKTLRVNNVEGSTAQYSTVKDALDAASEGDVIMVDASPFTYGDIEITKKITLQGPGFNLVANGMTQEGQNTALFKNITLKGEGIKVSSVTSFYIYADNATNCVITRCKVATLYSGRSNVIHQNFIDGSIQCWGATNVLITNNIINFYSNTNYINAKGSTIKYNTFLRNTIGDCSDCVVENNIGRFPESSSNNTIKDNTDFPEKYYEKCETDADFKPLDEALTTSCGAFAGDDPYRISGIATGPVVEDIDVPASVEQGSDLKVKVTIVTKK